MAHRDRTGWLGRQDSNLGMAESKSTQFPCSVNTHSEIQLKFDRLRINGLASDSEWSGASADDAIQKVIAERVIIDPQIQARLAASRV
jgi:hypothetical protein